MTKPSQGGSGAPPNRKCDASILRFTLYIGLSPENIRVSAEKLSRRGRVIATIRCSTAAHKATSSNISVNGEAARPQRPPLLDHVGAARRRLEGIRARDDRRRNARSRGDRSHGRDAFGSRRRRGTEAAALPSGVLASGPMPD